MISHYSTFFLNMQWAEVDSNHRSKLQQIYSLSPLATRESTHMKFYCLPTDIIQINCLMQADDRTRTDNLLITNQLLCQLSHIGRLPDWQVGGGGFEPPKQFAADLQSVPFGHSGNHP